VQAEIIGTQRKLPMKKHVPWLAGRNPWCGGAADRPQAQAGTLSGTRRYRRNGIAYRH